MEEIKGTENKRILLNIEQDFMPDLGREDSLKQFEDETVLKVINPIESYETMRYIHKPYSGLTNQCDIWYYFYFYNNLNPPTHVGGLDYSLIGITDRENALMTKQTTNSFFRLEFFKVKDDQQPEKTNRKLAFSRTLTIPLGEKIFKVGFNDFVHVPIFTGTNYRNKENMYLFWFFEDTAISQSVFTGNTFYMTVRFFNSDDGSIINFANKSKSQTASINEISDLYYLMEINKNDFTYQIFEYNGTKGQRVGISGKPIKFYEIMGGET